jgi:hypothetical protein
MAQQKSLADKLVFFLRVRDEALSKIEEVPKDGDAWPTLAVMVEEQEKVIGDALYLATMTAERLGRLAESTLAKKRKA